MSALGAGGVWLDAGLVPISAHLGCPESGCMWTFGEGVGDGHDHPICRNACQAPCPDEALVSAAFVKASCISVPGMGSGQKWGVNPNRIPESWSSEAGEAWSSRKDVARLPWGAKGCWSSGGGWCLGPCHSVPPFVICEMESRPPLGQGSCGGSIVLTGIESSVQGSWCVVGAQYMAAKSTIHAVGL